VAQYLLYSKTYGVQGGHLQNHHSTEEAEGKNEMKTILIVDDERDFCTLLSDSLSLEGYRVLTAQNGRKALERVAKETPDLVLMDIKMPGMNGIEVLERIKKVKEETPVIILTAYGTLETARKAMKLGADDYVTKPVDHALLKSLVKEALVRSDPERKKTCRKKAGTTCTV
jgi:DNA-binding NtrC family response regulator